MAVSETSPWRHADPVLLALPFAISGLGLLMIYSSSRTRLARQGVSQLYYVERQSLAIVLGVIAMAVVLAIDYRRVRDLWPLVYLAVLPLLIGVLVTGQRHKGAQAWFQVGPLQFQPSEITKVAVVVAIAGYCHQHRNDLDAGRLAVAIALAGFVMALVFLQHDLGTTLVILVCSFAVLVVAGLRPVHIGVLVLIGVTPGGRGRRDREGRGVSRRSHRGLPRPVDHQPAGLEADAGAVQPHRVEDRDRQRRLRGRGTVQGSPDQPRLRPEQHTDFIFTVVGEELGFLGGATLIGLYGLLVWRVWRTALLSSDFFGTLLAVGVLGIFAFQVFENIGMTMGIMPITGIPLPFMSYGGSAIIASFIAIGLVANVNMRRFS